jgi:imidazolonepropionase-like amidohydrolase
MTSTVFRGGQVFDGTGAPLRAADLLIESDSIVEVGDNLNGDETIDCTGKTLLPGFFDCHVHMGITFEDLNPLAELSRPYEETVLRFPQIAHKYLELGITTVRDASLTPLGYKTSVENGLVAGPRMQVSVTMLSMTGGHTDTHMTFGIDPFSDKNIPGLPNGVCDGVDSCIAKTREVVRAGADVIKIAASGGFFSPLSNPHDPAFLQEEMDAIVRTAGDLGRAVMAHSHGAEAIKRAVRAGVRSIEHGTFLDEEGAQMMAEAGTWLVATLTTGDSTEQMANDPTQLPTVREKFANLGRPELNAFRMAAEAGVKIAMGTDCPVTPHGTNLRELELMSENGLTAEQSLVATTSSAAELMGLDDRLGTLEPGKTADVVVVDGDTFEFATLGDRIEQVWKDGVRVVPD